MKVYRGNIKSRIENPYLMGETKLMDSEKTMDQLIEESYPDESTRPSKKEIIFVFFPFYMSWKMDPLKAVYVLGTRESFAVLKTYLTLFKKVMPQDSELFDKMLATKSESEFLEVLKNSDYESSSISIMNLNKEGEEPLYSFV